MEKKRRILLIDDEVEFVGMLAPYIRSHGFDVQTALDSSEAIQKVTQTACDLIIADMNLPGMNGIELVKRIRDKYPEQQVILITAYPAQWSQDEGRKLGVVEYLVKPLNPEGLIEIIENVLRINT